MNSSLPLLSGRGSEPVSARRRAGEGGNALLESALVLMPMLALMFGIVDVSFGIYAQSTLSSAAREGTRYAITYNTSCSGSQAACVATVVQNNAIGLPAGLGSQYITVNYYTTNNLSTPVMACSNGSCTTNSICGSSQTAACTNGSLNITLTDGTIVNYVNSPGNVVEVVIGGYPWNWMVPMPGYQAGTGITMRAASVDVLGGLAVGTSTPPTP
jgi:Flp pilus assembly protein TadG